MAELTSTNPSDELAELLDELVPPPRAWWIRLAIGVAIMLVSCALPWMWATGWFRPQPDWGGSSSNDARLSRTPDGDTVEVSVLFFNYSPQAVVVRAGQAELPGAEVVSVLPAADDEPWRPTVAASWPVTVGESGRLRIIIRLRPTTCSDSGDDWGSVSLDLDVADAWWPTIGREYTLPDPIFSPSSGGLSTWAGVGEHASLPTTPLAAACALLASDE